MLLYAPGKQQGSKGFWRQRRRFPKELSRYPEQCVTVATYPVRESCPYMGFYVYGSKKPPGVRIYCTLHHYYGAICDCGHETKARPGEGESSKVEGVKKTFD